MNHSHREIDESGPQVKTQSILPQTLSRHALVPDFRHHANRKLGKIAMAFAVALILSVVALYIGFSYAMGQKVRQLITDQIQTNQLLVSLAKTPLWQEGLFTSQLHLAMIDKAPLKITTEIVASHYPTIVHGKIKFFDISIRPFIAGKSFKGQINVSFLAGDEMIGKIDLSPHHGYFSPLVKMAKGWQTEFKYQDLKGGTLTTRAALLTSQGLEFGALNLSELKAQIRYDPFVKKQNLSAKIIAKDLKFALPSRDGKTIHIQNAQFVVQSTLSPTSTALLSALAFGGKSHPKMIKRLTTQAKGRFKGSFPFSQGLLKFQGTFQGDHAKVHLIVAKNLVEAYATPQQYRQILAASQSNLLKQSQDNFSSTMTWKSGKLMIDDKIIYPSKTGLR